MITFKAYKLGVKRIYQAQRYIYVVYALNLAIALIFGVFLSLDIQSSLGNSLSAENLRQGWDALWFAGFQESARGIAKSFDPTISGIGAVFRGLDAVIRGDFLSTGAVLGVALLYWGIWIYLSAGFIGMFYNGSFDGIFGQHFFAEAGRFFLRFFMLSLLALATYAVLFYALLPLANHFLDKALRDIIDEPRLFKYTAIKYALLWVVVLLINQVFDYAKIIVITHDVKKHDVLQIPLKALGFIFAHPLKVGLLFLLCGLTWLLWLAFYTLIAPGAWQSSWFTIIFGFFLGQFYIVGRIAIRCLFYAGQTALYYYEYLLPATEARQLPARIPQ